MDNNPTTAVVLQQTTPLPIASLAELHKVGDLLSQTELFGTKNPAEGFVIAAMCHQEGLSFRKWMETYHMVKGRVSKRADAMQADFQRGGGKVKVVQRDSEGAVIDLEYNGSTYQSRCIWTEIKNEPFTKDHNGKVKDNYATPRKRMQMLWARAISDGIRVVAPQFVQGVYTPEEVEAFDDNAVSVSVPARPRIPAAPAAPVKAIEAKPAPARKQYEQPVFEAASAAEAEEVAADEATPAAEAEETPFDDAAEAAPNPLVTCPIPGRLFGQRWEDMDTAVLQAAIREDLVAKYSEMTPEVVARVREILLAKIQRQGEEA